MLSVSPVVFVPSVIAPENVVAAPPLMVSTALELPLLVTVPPPLVPSASEKMPWLKPPRSSLLNLDTCTADEALKVLAAPPLSVLALVPSPTSVRPE